MLNPELIRVLPPTIKDKYCYLVGVVLLTCLLDDTNTVLLTCLDYGPDKIQIRSVAGDLSVTS